MTPKELASAAAEELSFEQWWIETGRFYDPDTTDVSWYDKRESLAKLAYEAAIDEATKELQAEVDKLRLDRDACIKFIKYEMTWCGWRDDSGDTASSRNAKKLQEFLERREAADANPTARSKPETTP